MTDRIAEPDAALADLSFVAFDLETTGCSAAADRTVEIGAVWFDAAGNTADTFNELVNPGVRIGAEVMKVHGITNEAVADAPPLEVVLPPVQKADPGAPRRPGRPGRGRRPVRRGRRVRGGPGGQR